MFFCLFCFLGQVSLLSCILTDALVVLAFLAFVVLLAFKLVLLALLA